MSAARLTQGIAICGPSACSPCWRERALKLPRSMSGSLLRDRRRTFFDLRGHRDPLSFPLRRPRAGTSHHNKRRPLSILAKNDSSKAPRFSWKPLRETLGSHAVTAAIALGAVLAWGGIMPSPAEAARSGGRMGGSAFSRSAASSFHGSKSFGGSGMGSSFGSSSSLRRYRSFGPGSQHRTSITTNAFFFSPWGFGFGYGYPMGYGGGMTSLLFWAVFAVIAVQVVRGVLNRGDDFAGELDTGERLTVAKLQVGLLASARDLQRDLERIALRADTTTSSGLHYVLQETVISLLRNPDFAIYGYARSGIERSAEDAEARFNKLSLEERGKFERETRVNVSGRQSSGITRKIDQRGALNRPISELIVVTILVAADGRFKLPKVTDRSSLVDALTTLGGIPASSVLAVEVLWTPEEEDDFYTVEDIVQDYPLLNTL